MSALETITRRAKKARLSFLVAGGHAVIAHGHPRSTFDLDLIICREEKEEWRELVLGLGYIFYREGPTFLQFNPPDPQTQPLPLMFVSPDTFVKLTAEAVPAPPKVTSAKIVSLAHLLALKCHAIKHGHERRVVKDADDVIQLVLANRLDINAPEWHELFLKHGTWNSMKKSDAPAGRPDKSTFEFPDWSGMDDSSRRLSVEAAFALCEEYARLFRSAAHQRQSQRDKCPVEFIL